jgi:hypothetical protein
MYEVMSRLDVDENSPAKLWGSECCETKMKRALYNFPIILWSSVVDSLGIILRTDVSGSPCCVKGSARLKPHFQASKLSFSSLGVILYACI